MADPVPIRVVPFRKASREQREALFAYVVGLEPERDDEEGPSALRWLQGQLDAHPYPHPQTDLFETFLAFDGDGNFVATASIVADDNGVMARHQLRGLGMWGLFNVRYDLRNRTIGTQLAQFMDKHIQRWVKVHQDCGDREARERAFHLFTDDPYAAQLYRGVGFIRTEVVVTRSSGAKEDLFTKIYHPV